MSIKKMTKDELELLSNKDITNLLLEESKTFEDKIADYYTALATDKRFILLEDGSWDLRSRHTSDKVVKVTDEEDEEIDENKEELDNLEEEEGDEDSYDDTDDDDYDDGANEELKDLVIIDEDELELEQ